MQAQISHSTSYVCKRLMHKERSCARRAPWCPRQPRPGKQPYITATHFKPNTSHSSHQALKASGEGAGAAAAGLPAPARGEAAAQQPLPAGCQRSQWPAWRRCTPAPVPGPAAEERSQQRRWLGCTTERLQMLQRQVTTLGVCYHSTMPLRAPPTRALSASSSRHRDGVHPASLQREGRLPAAPRGCCSRCGCRPAVAVGACLIQRDSHALQSAPVLARGQRRRCPTIITSSSASAATAAAADGAGRAGCLAPGHPAAAAAAAAGPPPPPLL